jgi:hypothetical protein
MSNKILLDRNLSADHAAQYLAKSLDALLDMVNYGSHLILRAYSTSPKGITEAVVIGVLLKQVVAMLDSIEVLLRQGISYTALLPVRAAFEASVYIDWILDSDSETKARHYVVANLRGEREWARRAIPGTPENALFVSIGMDMSAGAAKLEADAQRHMAEVNKILTRPEHSTIDDAFEQWRLKTKKDYDPAWYQLLGKSSLRQIAKAVKRLQEYTVLYSRGSAVTHAGLYKDHVSFAKGSIKLRPIRHLAESFEVIQFTIFNGVHTFRRVIEVYRPGEGPAFAKKYLEDWRDGFFSAKPINYKIA